MGIYYQVIKGLEPPISSIRQISNVLPKDGELEVANNSFKILIGLRCRISMEVSSDYTFPLEDRDIIVLPKPCTQIYRPHGRDTPSTFQTLVILFDRKQIFKPFKHWGNSLMERTARLCVDSFDSPTRFAAGSIPDADYLISQIRREAESRLVGREIRISALICALLIEIARATSQPLLPTQPERGNRKLLIHLADDFMYKNISRSLTIGEIAWHLKLSQEHLSRVFKQETGVTLKHYLGRMRVNHAKNLLLESNLPISRISEACGFSTSALFYRTFRQFFKMTPGEYRRSNQGTPTHHWITPTAEAPSRISGE